MIQGRKILLNIDVQGRITMTEQRWIPQIDLGVAGGVDPARLERSLGLEVRRVGHGRYLVRGGEEPHWVDLYTRRLPRCDCGDHIWRERVCKHILAVLLREGDERVITALARLVAGLRGGPARRHPGRA
jgi:hypothetical protein